MSPKAFYVAVTMAPPVSPTLLHAVVSRVCDVCGAPERCAELTRQLAAAVAQAERRTLGGDYQLRFQARDGSLDVAVSDGTHQLWHTTRPIG